MPHITYEYTVPRVEEALTATPASSTLEQPQLASIMAAALKAPPPLEPAANVSSPVLPFAWNEIEARRELRKEGNQSSHPTPKERAEVRGHPKDVRWKLQAPHNLSDPTRGLSFKPAELRNELESSVRLHEAEGGFGKYSELHSYPTGALNSLMLTPWGGGACAKRKFDTLYTVTKTWSNITYITTQNKS